MLRRKSEDLPPRVPRKGEDDAVALINGPNFFEAYENLLKEQTTFKFWQDPDKTMLDDFYYTSRSVLLFHIEALAKQDNSPDIWEKALFMCQRYAEIFPASLRNQAGEYPVERNFKHYLAYDNVPPHLARQYNPLMGIWRSAFIREAERPLADAFYASLFALATTLRGMGWGRDIANIASLKKHVIDSAPELKVALEHTHPSRKSALLGDLLKSLKAGSVIDEQKKNEREILEKALDEHLSSPLIKITGNYLGFFWPPAPENKPQSAASSSSRCVML